MMKLPLSFGRFFFTMVGFVAIGPLVAVATTFELRVDPVERDRVNLPVSAEISLPGQDQENAWSAELRGSDEKPRTVQLEMVGSGEGTMARVYWVEPFIAKDDVAELTLVLNSEAEDREEADEFRFEYGDDHQDLLLGDRSVYRLITLYDPERHADTHKPYHQIFGFNDEGFITKGPGGRFDHHKGIYLGWNQTRIGDGETTYDFWHARSEYQQHGEFLRERETTGPVIARSTSTTYWKRPLGEAVVRDTREVTTWNVADDQLVLDYVITIEPLVADIYLGGDAHHAGFQFRASQEVVENADATVVVTPRQAEEKPNDIWDNVPWVAMAFEIQGHPYTVVHMDHTETNPDDTTYSTRDYGRFGAFFTKEVKKEEPLVLQYRILIKGTHADDALSHAVLEGLHADYLSPASVRVSKR